jgi:hypothetical protein
LAPATALGAWSDFAPTPVDNGLWLETFSTWERNKNTAGNSVDWTDTWIKEKLTIGSSGYSYDPRFLQYHFTLGGVLSQEDYTSSSAALQNTGWRQRAGPEYSTKLTLLPEHFYNLVVFAARYEPMFRERAATEISQIENRRGLSFRYRKKPYFLATNFVNQKNDYGTNSTDLNQLALDGKYFLRTKAGNEVSFNGGFNPSWFSDSLGLSGSSMEYQGGNTVNLQKVQLTSSVVQRSFNQENFPQQNFDSNQFSVYELFNAFLPWNFRTDVSYRYRDDSGTIDQLVSQQSQHLTNHDNNVQANFVHRLYESLDSGYHFDFDTQDSEGGSSTSLFHTVDFSYTKLIPWGRLLTGVNLGTGESSNNGTSDVINEQHSAVLVPGSFRLQQPNVDRNTISVFMRSPLPPFELVSLVENVNYVVVPVPATNSFEIQVFRLPPRFVVPGTYDFIVSYASFAGNFDLRTNTLAQNASLELFDNQVTPYFGYTAVRPSVTSGSFPGEIGDTTTYTGGLALQRGPFRGRGEYQELQWNISPYRSWRGELQYVNPVSRSTNAQVTVSYLNRDYYRGLSPSEPAPFTDETLTASGYVQQELSFITEGLSVNIGGSYSLMNGLVDGSAYGANGSLSWVTGQLELLLGVTAYGSETSGSNTVDTKRENQYVYFHLRRRIF